MSKDNNFAVVQSLSEHDKIYGGEKMYDIKIPSHEREFIDISKEIWSRIFKYMENHDYREKHNV